MKITPISRLTRLEQRYHLAWMVLGVVISWVILSVPLLITASTPEPLAWAAAQVVICGVVLGSGRQGIDLLLIRIFISALALFVAPLIGDLARHHAPLCISTVDCLQLALLGIVGFGLYGTVFLSLIGLPVAMVWNGGVGVLRPVLPWSRVPWPRNWWQCRVLAGFIVVVLVGAKFLFAVPSP